MQMPCSGSAACCCVLFLFHPDMIHWDSPGVWIFPFRPFFFFLHLFVLNLQLLRSMPRGILPAEFWLNTPELNISVYNVITFYDRDEFEVGVDQLPLWLPERTEGRFGLFGCINSLSFLEIHTMPKFSGSESDPPCL